MQRKLQTIDMTTGEVYLPDEEEGEVALDDPIMRSLVSGKVPLHIQELINKHPDDPEAAEMEYNLFAGVEPESFDAYINREVNILGATFLPHPPFLGKDGEHHDGYWKVYLLTDEKDRNGHNIVLAVSGVNVNQHMVMAIKARGWYLWEKPVRYLITKGSKSGAYFLRNVEKQKPAQRASEHKA